tara:strand:+ start:303 stop:425 length:123 start_codon:yes stop_codon:yes gene_type:complete
LNVLSDSVDDDDDDDGDGGDSRASAPLAFSTATPFTALYR